MLPSNALELTRSALLNSFWRKDALRRFLRRMKIADTALANLNGIGTKREFIDWLFPKLESTTRGHSLLREIAHELASQTRFPDLEGWEDSELKITSAVASVNALRDWLDVEAKGRQVEESKRRIRETAERRRVDRLSHQASLSKLREELDALSQQIGTQAGGYGFQGWFGRLAALFEVEYKKAYRSGGRETDGSLTVGDMTYLLSLKFEAHQTAPADIDELKGRLHKVADFTMGLLISMSGFTDIAVDAASGAQSSILLIDHRHLYYILSGGASLADLVARVRRHASRTGAAYLPIDEFGR